jgi:hypothetical protein
VRGEQVFLECLVSIIALLPKIFLQRLQLDTQICPQSLIRFHAIIESAFGEVEGRDGAVGHLDHLSYLIADESLFLGQHFQLEAHFIHAGGAVGVL